VPDTASLQAFEMIDYYLMSFRSLPGENEAHPLLGGRDEGKAGK
jgi:hypothetical protein